MRGGHFHTMASLPSGEEPLVTLKQKTECAAELGCASSLNGTTIPDFQCVAFLIYQLCLFNSVLKK
jgi:hypothetical protein